MGQSMTHPLFAALSSATASSSLALVDGDRRLTFAELERASAGVAAALARRGVVKGDRVAVVVQSSVDAVIVMVGALRRGAVVVPVNPGYKHEELAHVLDDAGCEFVVDGEGSDVVAAVKGDRVVVSAADLVVEGSVEGSIAGAGVVDVEPDDLALLIYTSGTTGRSKGCAHTAGGLAEGIGALVDLWGITADDVVINALPLFHVHGLCVCLLGALLRGAQTTLVTHFSVDAVVAAVAAGGTVFMSVPTMVHRILAAFDARPDDAGVIARLRLMTCGSAALSAEMLLRFRERTGLTLLERYGMTETLITLSNPLVGARKPGSVGLPVPGVAVRVVDDELQVRGPGVMRGYWNRDDADAESFVVDEAGHRWFKTGDVVARDDDDGAVRIVGRASQDIAKVGGFKISLREIEEQLERHAAVHEVSVVSVADDEWGEKIVAVVVLRAGASLTLDEAQAATALTAVKKPRALVVVDALPRNAMGKVMKPQLKAQLKSQR